MSKNDWNDGGQKPEPKCDWRIGLACKPKYRTDPRYYERGEVIDVHQSGTGGVFDDAGVLRIKLDHNGEVILQRADDWVTA